MQIFTPEQLIPLAIQTGRWTIKQINDQPTLYTTNLGSYLRFKVNNSSLVKLNVQHNHHPLSPGQFYAIRIDSKQWQRFVASQPIEVSITSQAHIIEVMTAGNSDLDQVWSGNQGFAINSLILSDHATISSPAQRPVVDFIGDSITAGCWLNGRHAAADYRPESNYVARCCDLLGIDSVRIAYSAGGVLRPATGGVPTAAKFLKLLDHETVWQANSPDLAVVNLGVNDRRYSTEKFSSAYHDFLQQVVTIFPMSPLVIMTPFAQTFAHEIKDIAGSFPNVTTLDTSGWCTSYTDGIHPDQTGANQAGRRLAEALTPFFQRSV